MPLSSMLFVAVGALFLAQLWPATGVFLMLFAASYWSMWLINLGFFGIAIEVAAGRVGRVWLVLPVAWFGGYAACTLVEHAALWRLRAGVAAANAGVQVPFDPAQQDLVVTGGLSASTFVEEFGLPVAFEKGRRYRSAPHTAIRIADAEVCRQIRQDKSFQHADVYAWGRHDDGKFDTTFCIVETPEDPPRPAVSVAASSATRVVGGMPVEETAVEIEGPDGAKAALRGGHAWPLTWLPQLILGCALSGSAGWRCFMHFKRDAYTPLQADDPRFGADSQTVARVLGLTRVPPADRRATDRESMLGRAIEARRRVIEDATARLDRVIADPGSQATDASYEALRGRLDILRPRVAGIIAAVETGAEAGGQARRNAETIFILLRQIPPGEIAPVRGDIDRAGKRIDQPYVYIP